MWRTLAVGETGAVLLSALWSLARRKLAIQHMGWAASCQRNVSLLLNQQTDQVATTLTN